jgi:hypothetical protein
MHSITCGVEHSMQHRSGSNPRSSVVRIEVDPSIARARAVTTLRTLLGDSRLSTLFGAFAGSSSVAHARANAALAIVLDLDRPNIHRGAFAGGPSIRPACAA